MIKRLLILILLVISFFPLSMVLSDDINPFEEKEYKLPIVEELDLKVNGSASPILLNLTSEFDWIRMLSVTFVWRDNAIDFDKYGAIAALTNGTEFLYDNKTFIGTFKCLECYLSMCVDSIIVSDDKNPIDNHFIGFIYFHDHLTLNGLKMREGHTFNIRINDDLTSVGTEHTVRVFGYRLIDRGYEFKRSFLEEVMLIDNPFELLLWPIVIPLAFIFTAEPTYVIMGVAIFIVEILVIRMVYVKMRY